MNIAIIQKDPMPDVWDGNVAQEIAENLDPNVEVVVCSYDLHISYLKIMKAISYLARYFVDKQNGSFFKMKLFV